MRPPLLEARPPRHHGPSTLTIPQRRPAPSPDRAAGHAGGRAGLTTHDLDRLADGRPPDEAAASARRFVAHLRAADALAEVRSGAVRISDLVSAMRDYTYLDQGPVQDVEIGPSLDATLTVLGHRLHPGGVEVVRD